jgi:hypothetical protein
MIIVFLSCYDPYKGLKKRGALQMTRFIKHRLSDSEKERSRLFSIVFQNMFLADLSE